MTQGNMDYEARLVRFEQRYEAEQDAFFSARSDDFEPEYVHQVLIGKVFVEVEDFLVKDDADYQQRGSLLNEGADSGLNPLPLVHLDTEKIGQAVRGR